MKDLNYLNHYLVKSAETATDVLKTSIQSGKHYTSENFIAAHKKLTEYFYSIESNCLIPKEKFDEAS